MTKKLVLEILAMPLFYILVWKKDFNIVCTQNDAKVIKSGGKKSQ